MGAGCMDIRVGVGLFCRDLRWYVDIAENTDSQREKLFFFFLFFHFLIVFQNA